MEPYLPKVSIVIPVYNGGNYLRQAIDSAIAQTYLNTEIIVVNDGSCDNGETEGIALSYGDKIRYFYKSNGGCASALNYGISKMTGEWFSWLSHDDLYYPDKIKVAVDIINRMGFADKKVFISCGSSVIDKDGKEMCRRHKLASSRIISSDALFRKLISPVALNGCALLIPKKALDSVGEFRTDYVYILDWIYWIELALQGFSVYIENHILVQNRKHKEQVSVKKRDKFKTEEISYSQELFERYQDDEQKCLAIWQFAYVIGNKSCREAIEKCYSIPLKLRVCAVKRKLRRIIKRLVKRIFFIL